jgi:methylmalonyl-CoA/ethylmalonyl-CoA epimerase
MSLKFHHIGVACRNIKKEIESITQIHEVIDIGPIVFDKEQKAELCLLKTSEGVVIELISGEQVENILKKRITYYHLCYETNDIVTEIARLQNLGALVISDSKSAILFGNRQVAFLQVSYGLIELVQL